MYKISPFPYKVADVPIRERPRELLDRYGFASVQLEVLIAVILRSGVRGKNVIEMAKELIRDYGSLTAMAKAEVQQLAARPGMGKVKAQVLKSALELARRLTEEQVDEFPVVKQPADAAALLTEEARLLEEEHFWALFLDGKNRLKAKPRNITRGILNASIVHPREVFRGAIASASAAVILAHNHPSGDPTPSPEDIKITRQLVQAGKIVGIEVLDHLIIGKKRSGREKEFVSMREDNIVAFT